MSKKFPYPWRVNSTEIWVCSSNRLARMLQSDLADTAQRHGQIAWANTSIMTWSGLTRTLKDRFVAGGGVRATLSDQQSLLLWKKIIETQVPFGAFGFVKMAKSAWSRIHQWGLSLPWEWDQVMVSDDQARFVDWAAEYAEACSANGWMDDDQWLKRLPAAIAEGLVSSSLRFVFRGFDLGLTPAQQATVEALREAGCAVDVCQELGSKKRFQIVACEEEDEELEAAAAWAERQIGAGKKVGVVVTGLERRIDEIDRVFWRRFQPDHPLVNFKGHPPWHVSLGAPMSSFPLISRAMKILALDDKASLESTGALLRSPYVAGWLEEGIQRAEFDRRVVRALPGDCLSLKALAGLLEQEPRSFCPLFRQALNAWATQRASGMGLNTPTGWVRQWLGELDAFGLGGGKDLTSREYQCWSAFLDLMDEFAALDLVVDDIDRFEALEMLEFLVSGRLFREENPGVPIEIMSPKEAMGGRFDALWVTGLDDLNWPGPAEPDPLIPLPEQLSCPSATAEGSVEIAEVTLSRLAASASVAEQAGDIRVGSFSAVRDEMPMRLSGLVVDTSCSACEILGAGWRSYPEKAVLERVGEDARGTPHPAGRVRGGTKVLRLQSACPFKAFAVHRLGAEALPSPTIGLSRMDRGNVVHDVLEGFWQKFRSLQAVQAQSDEVVRRILRELADGALKTVLKRNPLAVDDEGFELELERVCERVFELVRLEKQRPDFDVVETEKAKQVCIGELEFNLKIDRVDRIDGGLFVIDYKTGTTKLSDWVIETGLADPQVPIYLMALDEVPVGMAFGKVKVGEVGYQGVSGFPVGISGVSEMNKASRGAFKDYSNWSSLVNGWRREISRLAGEFGAGEASVAPRHRGECDFCHLKSFCRIDERKIL